MTVTKTWALCALTAAALFGCGKSDSPQQWDFQSGSSTMLVKADKSVILSRPGHQELLGVLVVGDAPTGSGFVVDFPTLKQRCDFNRQAIGEQPAYATTDCAALIPVTWELTAPSK